MAQARPALFRARQVTRLAWSTLVYTGLVILFGAVVRITGSGAGCGQHWPTCQGEIAHLPRSVGTAIELSHRVTSGLSFVLVLVLVLVVRRVSPASQLARRAAHAAFAFMIVEVLVGAALVLLALVGSNDTVARAAVMGMHLVNTFLLMASLALVTHGLEHPTVRSSERRAGPWFAFIAVGLLVVSVTGAVTALGDTVRPVAPTSSLAQRLGGSYTTTAHFLDTLRALHPAVATLAAIALVIVGARLLEQNGAGPSGKLVRTAIILVIAQTAVGTLNIWLGAPGWLQVSHLGLALVIWVLWVLAWAAAPPSPESEANPGLPEPAPPVGP